MGYSPVLYVGHAQSIDGQYPWHYPSAILINMAANVSSTTRSNYEYMRRIGQDYNE